MSGAARTGRSESDVREREFSRPWRGSADALAVEGGVRAAGRPRPHQAWRAVCAAAAAWTVVLTLVSASGDSARASAQSWEATRATLLAFFDAYNRSDLAAALALADPRMGIAGCDYLRQEMRRVDGKARVAQWLRDRFAEHDRLDVTDIHETGFGLDTVSPLAFGLSGAQTNDLVRARGLVPQAVGGKGSMSDNGLIQYLIFGPSSCQPTAPRPGAGATTARVVATEFLDTYNAEDTHRLLQIVTRHVTYTDDAHCRPITRRGKAELREWLAQRFKEDDRLRANGDIQVSASQPEVATLAVVRSSRWWRRRGMALLTSTVRLVLGKPPHTRISSVAIRPVGSPCSAQRRSDVRVPEPAEEPTGVRVESNSRARAIGIADPLTRD